MFQIFLLNNLKELYVNVGYFTQYFYLTQLNGCYE